MMLTDDVWDGVQAFLDLYVSPTGGDVAIVAYTADSREPAAWICVALRGFGVLVHEVWMHPLRDSGFPDRIAAAISEIRSSDARVLIFSFERDTMSHDKAFRAALKRLQSRECLIFRTISACSELFTTALRSDPREIESLNATLLEKLTKARHLHIETDGGSKIDVLLDNSRYQWVSNRGLSRQGRMVILPAGEVATFPRDVSGQFVADFAFNVNAMTRRDTRLTQNPVRVTLENGKATEYNCADAEIQKFLDQCFRKYCAFNVGELGFGTNRAVQTPIAMNSHINERRPGVHLGFGQHNQEPSVVPYQCEIHLDLVADGGRLWVDGNADYIDLSSFPPSNARHPGIFRDEDVFAPDLDDLEIEDCCGVLEKGEMKLFRLEPE